MLMTKIPITIWVHPEHFIGTTNSCRFRRTPAASPLPIPFCRGEGLTSSPMVPRAEAFSEQLGRPTALMLLMHMHGITLASLLHLFLCGFFSPQGDCGGRQLEVNTGFAWTVSLLRKSPGTGQNLLLRDYKDGALCNRSTRKTTRNKIQLKQKLQKTIHHPKSIVG